MELKKNIDKNNKDSLTKIFALPEKRICRTPITLKGIIVPWHKEIEKNVYTDFKIMEKSGAEYFLLTNEEWKNVCLHFLWESVKLKGLFDRAKGCVSPEEINSKDPDSNRAKLIPIKSMRMNRQESLRGVPLTTLLPVVS